MGRTLALVLLGLGVVAGQEIKLPKPQVEGGKPLMQALAGRKTSREFSERKLEPQVLSNLLWAAFGVNREKMGRGVGRTAPSAMNKQEVQLYVLLEEGAFVYEAGGHVLKPVVSGDLRGSAGPAAGAKAAVTLVYVAGSEERWAGVDSGFIGQNVYLFASAFGLNAWFRASGLEQLGAKLKLPEGQKAWFAQTVGYAAGQ